MLRKATFAALAAPLVLALAACGSGNDETAADVAGDPIDPVAAPEGQQWMEVAVETEEGGYRIGNPDAPLKLLEFASLTCPHCADFAEEARAGIDAYVNDGTVSYELRNQIHDPLDLTMSMLTRCGTVESFHPLSNQVWDNLQEIVGAVQANPEALNKAVQAPAEQRYEKIAEAAGLLDFFAARGISRDQAKECLAQPEMAEQIVEESNTQSEEMDVTGTPTFFLNGRKLDGNTWAAIEADLQQAGAR
ncbi:thioredoxin domain-containing protein [Altererythrobacter endophyticus]|uniref:Thioredoxin domain-containing protein n=2 Tax=Altericroceibacterium endophyticum TaxID=1808508 RepID=A0A6I4TAJ2_9SPHN|nr:thioredoxin domain-containing protein [Altericroceibacterium endophyticum]